MKNALLLLVFATALISCAKGDKNKKVKTVDFTFTKEGTLTIAKSDGSDTIFLHVEFAETPYERETGLMHRESMENNQSMLFIFPGEYPRSFFMKNTLIPLDIIYFGADKKIVSFQKNAQPLNETSLPSEIPAMYVLEVNAGLSDKWELQVGDTMNFTRK